MIDEILYNLLCQLLEINQIGSLNNTPLAESAVEIKHYLMNAFGNRDRMDYGTGHELSFLAFLMCYVF